jgi:hypothetical protein
MRTRRGARLLFGILSALAFWCHPATVPAADCQADPACKAALEAYQKALEAYETALQKTFDKYLKLEDFETQLAKMKNDVDSLSGKIAQLSESFKTSKLKQFVDELKDAADKKEALDKAAEALGQKAGVAAAASTPVGPASPAQPASAIKIVSADYGVLRSPLRAVCDATGYFAKICEYATAETPYCTDSSITDMSKCPEGKKSTRLTRTTRSFCEVPISKTTKLCGDYDPAPMGEREAKIIYKCGNTQQSPLLLKEGEVAYLRCG